MKHKKRMKRCLILFTKEMQFTNILEKKICETILHISEGQNTKVGNHLVTKLGGE